MALDLQHSSDLLAERVNAYFGYSLVQGLRLRQVPLHRKQQPAPLRRSPGSGGKGAEASQERFSMIEDSDLRKALQRLADAVDTAGSRERL